MISRDDMLKAASVLALIAGAIAAHTIKLPATWEWVMPYTEFLAGVGAIVTAAYMKRPNGKDDETDDR